MSDEIDGVTPILRRASSAPQIKVTYFSEIEETFDKIWMVEDFLAAGETTCIYGAPGGYKSTVVGDLAAHIACGMPWMGRETQKGVVIYVAAERASLVKRRLRAWAKHHGVSDAPVAILEASFDLFSSTAYADEIAAIGRHAAEVYGLPVVWVIIDTKARTMGEADPNSDRDAIRFVDNVDLIRVGCGNPHVSVVDHVPHSSPERMKNSGAFPGAIDGSFLVQKVRHGLGRITIGSKPPNDGPDELDIQFGVEAVEIGVDARGKPTVATVLVAGAGDAALLPTRPKIKLTPAAQKVMAAFRRLVDEGKTHNGPVAPGMTPGTPAVLDADLREMAFRLGVYPEPEPQDPKERGTWRKTRSTTYTRGFEKLTADGVHLLRIQDGFVWEPSQRGSPFAEAAEWAPR